MINRFKCESHISEKARIGNNVKIGNNSIIYDNVEIGDNTIICENCIIGEPCDESYSVEDYFNPVTVIGCDSLIRSGTIIYAGNTIGNNFTTGHRVTIRENCNIANNCSIGTMSDIQADVILGSYCRLHSSVHLSQGTKLGSFVFMYPFSIVTNDPYPPSGDLQRAILGDFSQVGVQSVILAGVNVGENCLIGAGSIVNRDVKNFSLVSGNPAKVQMDIRNYVVLGKGKPYPWMDHFDRGMPWENIGFEKWMNSKSSNNLTL